jgi:GR25 family glycosyltransferase involved in LPS biosynthesis
MNWLKSISKIVLINLTSRVDRLLKSAEILEKYSIPYERVAAIQHEQGAVGLRDTVVKLFNDCIALGHENVLVFEDDVFMVVGEDEFHNTMNGAVAQLPENYHILFLGAQCTGGFTHFHSPNLLPVQKAFATHAWLVSRQGMKEILASNLQAPIDNHIVAEIEPMGHCFVTYPLLCSQREDFSDIGQNRINWHPFIHDRYYQKISEMRGRR